MIIEEVICILIFLTSLPAGIFLARICSDELVKDRKYFIYLALFLLIIGLTSFFLTLEKSIALSSFYMVLVMIILIKSKKLLGSFSK